MSTLRQESPVSPAKVTEDHLAVVKSLTLTRQENENEDEFSKAVALFTLELQFSVNALVKNKTDEFI